MISGLCKASVVVRYFARPDNYWEGERFPMKKLQLLHQKITDRYLNPNGDSIVNVEFRHPELPDDFEDTDVGLLGKGSLLTLLEKIHTRRFLTRLKAYAMAGDEDKKNASSSQLGELARAEFETGIDSEVIDNEIRDLFGTVSSVKDALANGKFGFNIGGGNHHAFPDYGHGYCIMNDVSAGVISALEELRQLQIAAPNVLVIDLDVHQGDGVASMFGPTDPINEAYSCFTANGPSSGEYSFSVDRYPWGDYSEGKEDERGIHPDLLTRTSPYWRELQKMHKQQRRSKRHRSDNPSEEDGGACASDQASRKHDPVFLVSLHQESNFPPLKIPSHIDIPLDDEIGDDVYLGKLAHALKAVEDLRGLTPSNNASTPESSAFHLCIYVAGADPYVKDPLGGINISMKGLRRRDQMVAQFCKKHGIPVAVVLAGGYADADDVAQIHFQTFEEMVKELYG
eukprot:TRINITY_DN47310_c0_g1_i1.p1 TRINITY_DN47310_c0_g1~~TRINITY_DN47310_c0_g1_i1.p1  ORF type:complete len:478 (-),score=64.42 TRINITY_DN47310_c0_g1_i1:310-1674(-)